MSGKLQSVKGTRDLLPPETAVWAAVEAEARRTFGSYGYREIRTPLLESTELFVRSVGEETDIVGKEMYTFEDRKGRSLTLRPEGTAGVARAFVQHGLASGVLPAKLFYIGAQFRYERPQRGRYRQFHQIGAELIGDPGPGSDVELLAMLVRFLGNLGFEGLTVRLNTVGDAESRQAYRERLVAYLEPFAEELGEDSRRRLETNPLRILDTKVPAERALLADAPRLEDCLSAASAEHFAAVRAGLERLGIEHRVEPQLVRGLDYYARTVFEIVAEGLGAQDAIVGGGRYDGLIEELGGAAVPALGFAIGLDRLIEILPETKAAAFEPPLLVRLVGVGVGDPELLALGEELREAGVGVEMEVGDRSLKAALKRAHRAGARWVVLLGKDELAEGMVTLRDLDGGEQETMDRAEAIGRLTVETA